MIIDDAKVQQLFNDLTNLYESRLSTKSLKQKRIILEDVMKKIKVLVGLDIEPDKMYPWARWYYTVKNERDGVKYLTMPDLPPMDGE